jgi:hypothetical protein
MITPQTSGVYLSLFTGDICIYGADHQEGYVLRKLQRGLSAIETRCERCSIKINKDKTQAIYLSHRFKPPEAHLTLNRRHIPFVSHVKYLGVIFDKRITWRLDKEMIEAKAFRTFIRFYSLCNNERLSADIKLTLYKALIRSVITYACPAWELAADTYLLKLQRLKPSFCPPLEMSQCGHRSAICTRLSTFDRYTII